MKQGLGLLLWLIALLSCLQAQDVSELTFSSIREKAMGGVGVVVSDSDTALFQNPAALNNLQGMHLKFPRLSVGATTDVLSKQKTFDALLAATSIVERLQRLDELVPARLSTFYGVTPLLSYSTQGLGVGVYMGGRIDTAFLRRTSHTLRITGHIDIAPMVGYARSFDVFGNDLSAGVSLKYINRQSIYNQNTGELAFVLEQADLLARINNLRQEQYSIFPASGFGVDVGVMGPLSVFGWEGKWGAAIHNLGATLKGNMVVSGNTESREIVIPPTTVLGIGLRPRIPGLGYFTLGADYKMGLSDATFMKSLHLGVEKSILWDKVKLRGGINQGYFVGGIGIDLVVFHLNYAAFAEELGPVAGSRTALTHIAEFGILF